MAHIDPDSTTAHIRHGIKTGLAAVAAYGAAQAMGLQYGYWAALSAVIVMQISVADSLQMCWYRLSGTAIGALIGVAAILAFPHTPAMTYLGLFLAVAFCAYMTRYDPRYRMAAITACIVFLASLGQQDRLLFGLERVQEIAIGVGCAFLASVLLWPQRAAEELQQRLRGQFTRGAELYGAILDAFLRRQAGLDPGLLDAYAASVAANRGLLHKVLRHERLLYRDDTRALGLKVDTLDSCARHLRTMLHSLNDSQGQGYDILMEPELRSLAVVTQDAMRAIGQGNPLRPEALEAALAAAEARLGELRDQGATRRFHLHKLMQFFSFFHCLRFLGRDLLRHALGGEMPGAPGAPKTSGTGTPATPEPADSAGPSAPRAQAAAAAPPAPGTQDA